MIDPKSNLANSSTTRVVADTAPSTSREEDASPGLVVDSDMFMVQRRTIHAGPLPDPATLRGLVDVYPDAAKIIFDDFHAQSAHRRDLERLRIATGTALALRSQMTGGGPGAIGLVGSFIVAGMVYQKAASTIGSASLVSLISVFVVGRDQKKRERIEKAALREKIRQGDPVEEIEKATSAPKSTRSATKPKKPKAG